MATPRAYIKPSRFAIQFVNPFAIRFGFAASLVVRGCHSGELREVAVAPIELGGFRYLVSIHGEADWVRNLRVSGTGELRRHGLLERFRATEVTGTVRVHVIKAYRAKLGTAVEQYFLALPDPCDHPVFRIDVLGLPSLSHA
jgi:hypothetical protein